MVVHTSDEEHTDEQIDELTSGSFLLHQFGAVCGERLSCNSNSGIQCPKVDEAKHKTQATRMS